MAVSGSNLIFPKTLCVHVLNLKMIVYSREYNELSLRGLKETLNEKDSKWFNKKRVFMMAMEALGGVTCIPIMAYMKNNMAISKQTYGSALKDCTNVQSRILIV